MRDDVPESEQRGPDEPHAEAAGDHPSDKLRTRQPIGDEGPDFAEEHDSASHAGEMAGGPEGEPEDDSPRGLAGAD